MDTNIKTADRIANLSRKVLKGEMTHEELADALNAIRKQALDEGCSMGVERVEGLLVKLKLVKSENIKVTWQDKEILKGLESDGASRETVKDMISSVEDMMSKEED